MPGAVDCLVAELQAEIAQLEQDNLELQQDLAQERAAYAIAERVILYYARLSGK